MSAFLCNPEHIGKLAAFTVEGDQWGRQTADEIATIWAKANLASVAYRYGDLTPDKAAEMFCGLDSADTYIAACVAATRTPHNLHIVDAFKMAQCLDYQSCEVENWLGSEPERLIDHAKAIAASRLPGYSNAPWEYHN